MSDLAAFPPNDGPVSSMAKETSDTDAEVTATGPAAGKNEGVPDAGAEATVEIIDATPEAEIAFGQVGKVLGERWKALSTKQRHSHHSHHSD